MRRLIVFREQDYAALRAHVLRGKNEEAAVCLGGHVHTPASSRILVREVEPVPSQFLVSQSGAFVEIDPVWLAARIKKGRQSGQTLLIVHSHPFTNQGVRFSGIDVDGQARLVPKVQARLGPVPYAEIVFGQESLDALYWDPDSTDPLEVDAVRVIGEHISDLHVRPLGSPAQKEDHAANARQILFLREQGQRRMSMMKVGLVGLGGNGGPMAMQLVHMGVGHIVAIDSDVVEESNRNRVPDARPSDDGHTAKVHVSERYARRVREGIVFEAVPSPVEESLDRLRDCDLLIGCTDTVTSRLVLNRLAMEYFIPLIDTGAEIEVEGSTLRTMAGRITVVRPGGLCLEALGIATEELAANEATALRPGYVPQIPNASVMSLNLLVAGMAGIEFLKLVHGLLGGSRSDRYFAYSARSGEVRACGIDGHCEHCTQSSGLGDAARGEEAPRAVKAS